MTTTESTGPKLKRGEKVFEVNGGNVVYEILGKEGDFIALTPGGRFSKDIAGLRPLAQALVKGGYRVLLWDRPNCGKSDVQFYGKSESHMRAETLHALITGLDIGPCIIAGGSGGARDSMLTTMLYPEIVRKLVVWNIVGGVYGVVRARRPLHRAEHPRGEGAGHATACCASREWKERIAEQPAQQGPIPRAGRRRVPQGDVALAQRVRLQARSDDPRRRGRDVRQHHGADADHPRRRERLGPSEADVTGSQLPDQGLQADRPAMARGRLGARRREVRCQGKVKRSACSTRGCRRRPRS